MINTYYHLICKLGLTVREYNLFMSPEFSSQFPLKPVLRKLTEADGFVSPQQKTSATHVLLCSL